MSDNVRSNTGEYFSNFGSVKMPPSRIVKAVDSFHNRVVYLIGSVLLIYMKHNLVLIVTHINFNIKQKEANVKEIF